jgi:hypothetical protein
MSDEMWTEGGTEAECDKHGIIVMYYFLLRLNHRSTWPYMLNIQGHKLVAGNGVMFPVDAIVSYVHENLQAAACGLLFCAIIRCHVRTEGFDMYCCLIERIEMSSFMCFGVEIIF